MKLITKAANRINRLIPTSDLSKLTRSYVVYQPILTRDGYDDSGERNCHDRWRLMHDYLQRRDDVSSFLDLGCAEGYYVLRAARELGCIALGIDQDWRRLSVAMLQMRGNDVRNAGFVNARIDLELVEKLPEFDVTAFMSVAHHVIGQRGLDYLEDLLRAAFAKTRQTLFFETGQSDEIGINAADRLPDMGQDPTDWIHRWLTDLKFPRVEVLGKTDAFRGTVKRTLFAITR